jgi:hypothetical protein
MCSCLKSWLTFVALTATGSCTDPWTESPCSGPIEGGLTFKGKDTLDGDNEREEGDTEKKDCMNAPLRALSGPGGWRVLAGEGSTGVRLLFLRTLTPFWDTSPV